MNAKLAADWNAIIAAYNARLDMLCTDVYRRSPTIPQGYHINADFVREWANRILELTIYFVDPAAPFVLADFHELFHEYDPPIGQYPSDFRYLSHSVPLTAEYRTLKTSARAGITLDQLDPWLDAAAAILAQMYLVPVRIPQYPEHELPTATVYAAPTVQSQNGTWYRDGAYLFCYDPNNEGIQIPAATLVDALAAIQTSARVDGSSGLSGSCGQSHHITATTNDGTQWTAYNLSSGCAFWTFHGRTVRPCRVRVTHAVMPGTDYTGDYPYLHNYPTAPFPMDITCALTAAGYIDYDMDGHNITAYAYSTRDLGIYTPGLLYGLDAPLIPSSTMCLDALTTFNPLDPYSTYHWSYGWHHGGNTHATFMPKFLLDYSSSPSL